MKKQWIHLFSYQSTNVLDSGAKYCKRLNSDIFLWQGNLVLFILKLLSHSNSEWALWKKCVVMCPKSVNCSCLNQNTFFHTFSVWGNDDNTDVLFVFINYCEHSCVFSSFLCELPVTKNGAGCVWEMNHLWKVKFFRNNLYFSEGHWSTPLTDMIHYLTPILTKLLLVCIMVVRFFQMKVDGKSLVFKCLLVALWAKLFC